MKAIMLTVLMSLSCNAFAADAVKSEINTEKLTVTGQSLPAPSSQKLVNAALPDFLKEPLTDKKGNKIDLTSMPMLKALATAFDNADAAKLSDLKGWKSGRMVSQDGPDFVVEPALLIGVIQIDMNGFYKFCAGIHSYLDAPADAYDHVLTNPEIMADARWRLDKTNDTPYMLGSDLVQNEGQRIYRIYKGHIIVKQTEMYAQVTWNGKLVSQGGQQTAYFYFIKDVTPVDGEKHHISLD